MCQEIGLLAAILNNASATSLTCAQHTRDTYYIFKHTSRDNSGVTRDRVTCGLGSGDAFFCRFSNRASRSWIEEPVRTMLNSQLESRLCHCEVIIGGTGEYLDSAAQILR